MKHGAPNELNLTTTTQLFIPKEWSTDYGTGPFAQIQS